MIQQRVCVCILISSFAIEGPQGGAERFAIEMARRLDASTFETVVCGLWEHGLEHEQKWRQVLHSCGVTTVTAASWTGCRWRDASRALSFLTRYFQEKPQDVINSHSAFADVAAVWGRLVGGCPSLVRTLHSEKEWYRHRFAGLLLNQLIFPWMFAVESGVSRRIVQDLDHRPLARVLRRRATVKYNSIDWDRFAPRDIDVAGKRESLGLPTDAPVVGNVARFTRQKGHADLLRAMSRVVRQLPEARLLLVGAGELCSQVRALADDLALGEHVHFVGTRDDIEEIYPVMDVFASASLWEGLPTVVIEAMAASVPVVCTAVSGSVELVDDGRTGLLVPPASPKALADAILRILRHPDEARCMAARARESARRFSIDEAAADYGRLFASCLREYNDPGDC